MDCSPLIKAHDHAFAAAVATKQSSDSTVAVSEHAQAAGEFANAARNTTSIEALRTLKLLEQHHRRLAEILRLPSEGTQRASDEELDEKRPRSARGQLSKENAPSAPDPLVRASQVPALQQKRRFASREMSSSIASNLASARGIRSSKHRGQPLNPSISNDQAPGNLDPHPRRDASKTKMQNIIEHQGNRPAWVPPSLPASLPGDDAAKGSSTSKAKAPPASTADAGFTRFYQSFGNLMNKISAPLAFAGLPLIQEEANTSERAEAVDTSVSALTSRRAPGHLLASPPLEPDLSKIYSKATMRALSREEHGASDSFYVVPTSGHTVSYANILSYAEKEKRRLEASISSKSTRLDAEEEEEDFVDARDTPVPLSPVPKRKLAASSGDRELRNKIEELSLENKSLKGMLDNVSRRLHAFEASSQHSAMALAESYRIMRPGSPAAGFGGKAAADTLRKRAQEMEEQLTSMTKHAEQLEKDNRKLQKMLEKYREKWDALKAGARARREAQAGESGEEARHT